MDDHRTMEKMSEKAYTWDSTEYAKHSSAQYEWAQELIGKLDLKSTESVLDIGCGDRKIALICACQDGAFRS